MQKRETEVISTHTPELFQAAVRRAAELLRLGDLVALPTETVYGLAANALDPTAVSQIFEVKRRPAHNPIIVHVSDLAMARRCVREWPAVATKLARAFWPGPLTLVLPRSGLIPDIVTAGGDTVGIRWPGHPFIRAVIRECGFPLAAPSANLSMRISPTNAEHVTKALGGRVALIVDGGQSQVGIESTVLDLTANPPLVLRPGMIHEESLAAVWGEVRGPKSIESKAPDEAGADVPRSPGLQERHYAPKAKLVVLAWEDGAQLKSQVSNLGFQMSETHLIAHTHIPSPGQWGQVSVIPHDSEAFARALYAELHRCDEGGAKAIVVERPPEAPEWKGVLDRLSRAAAE